MLLKAGPPAAVPGILLEPHEFPQLFAQRQLGIGHLSIQRTPDAQLRLGFWFSVAGVMPLWS
jgi:hypothetical protein